jgi:hypothetical protein
MGLPDVLMTKVDDYVDSLAPQIQPRIASELEIFQNKTIDSLETQVIDAFRSLFNKDKPTSSDGSRGPWNQSDSAPDAYGGQSLPFADEIAKLTRSFSSISDEAGGDLRDIFDLTEGRGGSDQSRSLDDSPRGGGGGGGGGARGFLTTALGAVQEHLENNQRPGGQNVQIGGLLGVLSGTLKDASQNPEEKARLISPEIKESVAEKLRVQHAPIAEQFTKIALDHIKRWLRGNTSTRDLGDGARAEIADQVGDLVKGLGGLFGKKKHDESDRGFDDSSRDADEKTGGFSGVISNKLSTGLAKVHREVRLEFRKILGAIERQLFEMLPDQFQRPLEKLLGGNPFDSQLDRDASGNADRGFGDDIKSKLLNKVRALVQKVQETLRESILGVVNGGHRLFEHQSWKFVQNMVEQKVQKYLPDVKISVPDDIGNENVSVGSPTSGTSMGGGQHPPPHHPGPPSDNIGGQGYGPPQGEYRPPQSDYRLPPPGDSYSSHGYGAPQGDYRPGSSSHEGYRPPQGDYRPDSSRGYGDQSHYRDTEHRDMEQDRPYPSHGYESERPPPHQGGYHQPSHSQSGYPSENYQQGYPQQGYPQEHYQQGYPQEHHQQGYPPAHQPQQGYGQPEYRGGEYPQHNYQQRY